jgi:hypothetical protein
MDAGSEGIIQNVPGRVGIPDLGFLFKKRYRYGIPKGSHGTKGGELSAKPLKYLQGMPMTSNIIL